jgi:hypothetical protein
MNEMDVRATSTRNSAINADKRYDGRKIPLSDLVTADIYAVHVIEEGKFKRADRKGVRRFRANLEYSIYIRVFFQCNEYTSISERCREPREVSGVNPAT